MSQAQVKASTAFMHLVRDSGAPIALEAVSGERSPRSEQAHEPKQKRPYVRVHFTRMHGPTDLPRLKYGIAHLEVFAVDGPTAWDKATALSDAMGLGDAVTPGNSPELNTIAWEGPGWQRGPDPKGGAMVYGSIAFTYFD